MRRSVCRAGLVLAAACMASVLTGCQPYTLTGKVITGPMPNVLTVGPSDRRLTQLGVAGATIEVTVDPSSLSPHVLGVFSTDADGQFVVPVDELMPGFLEYEVGLLVRADGYQDLWQQMDLPRGDKRLVIVLQQGQRRIRRLDSLDDAVREGQQLLSQ